MGKRTDPTSRAVLAAIGARLRQVIDSSGMRQQDVASRAGIGFRTLGWYLAGRDIPASNLLRIAHAIGMDPGELMHQLADAERDARSATDQSG